MGKCYDAFPLTHSFRTFPPAGFGRKPLLDGGLFIVSTYYFFFLERHGSSFLLIFSSLLEGLERRKR